MGRERKEKGKLVRNQKVEGLRTVGRDKKKVRPRRENTVDGKGGKRAEKHRVHMGFYYTVYLQNFPPTVQFVIFNAKRARQVRPPKLQGYLPQRACPQCRERRSG